LSPNATTGRSALDRAADLAWAVCLAGGVLAVLAEGALRIAAPYQVEFGEGNVLASAARMARGDSVYPLPAEPPYVFSTYGPLLYGLLSLAVRVFGVSFAAPRVLSALAMCAVALLLTLLLRRWTGSWRPALLFGPLFLTIPEASLWMALVRADVFALALSFAGLYAVAASPRRWPLAALLYVAALAVKPTLVAAAAATFFYLLARRGGRAATGFAALYAGLVLGGFGALQLATGGGFAAQVFGGHPEPYSFARYLWILRLMVLAQLLPVLLVVAFLVHDARRRLVTLPMLFVATAFAGTLTAGMAGAASNHFLEWSAAVCLGAGLAYHVAPRGVRNAALLGMAACAVALSIYYWLAPPSSWDAVMLRLPYQQRLFPPDARLDPECYELRRYLATRPGEPILSENTGTALVAGRKLLVTDPYAYAQLVMHGKWQAPPLEELVRRREVPTVVLSGEVAELRARRWDRWSPAMLDAIEQHYTLDLRFECRDGAAAYVPKPER